MSGRDGRADLTGDRIRLSGVSGTGFHGVYPHERRDGQLFVVDVEVEADLRGAGTSDDLSRTVNYGQIGALVRERIVGEPHDLIETLAEEIAADVLASPLVDVVTVTVHKPQAPVGVDFADVSVSVSRRREPVDVVIALGANLGDAQATLSRAREAIAASGLVGADRVSSFYLTEPQGGPEQPPYVNQVLVGTTRWSAPRVLRALHEIEAEFGRVREIRWGPRTLDLDLIQWGHPDGAHEWVASTGELTLPHPRAHERPFVLVPWHEVDPGARLRVDGRIAPVAELAARADCSGVRLIPGSTRDRSRGEGR